MARNNACCRRGLRAARRQLGHAKQLLDARAAIYPLPTPVAFGYIGCIVDKCSSTPAMDAITIQQTLLECGAARVVLANDAASRPVVGVSVEAADSDGHPVFVQIDRVTMLELERGTIDLPTVLADRCAGITVGA